MNYIFLTYINRSGSTFLSNELSKYQNIAVCPEADILTNLLLVNPRKKIEKQNSYIFQILKEDKQLQFWNLHPDTFNFSLELKTCLDLFFYILNSFQRIHAKSSKYILYKNERLFQILPQLLFNMDSTDIYTLSLIRDIRAIYYSQSITQLPDTNKKFSINPLSTSLYWKSYISALHKLSIHKHLSVKYEELIQNFSIEMERISKFLKLDLNSEKKNQGKLFDLLPPSHREIHSNINKNPLPERIDIWEKYLPVKDRTLIETATKKILSQLNYNLSNTKSRKISNKIRYLSFIINYCLLNLWHKVIFRLRLLKK